MKRILLPLLLAGALVGGCSSSDNTEAVNLPEGSGKALNPSGQPQTAEQADMAAKMKQAGDGMSKRMEEAAQAEKEAKQRTGGQ